jgi:ADP-heptose:LPS heptosyltransferase
MPRWRARSTSIARCCERRLDRLGAPDQGFVLRLLLHFDDRNVFARSPHVLRVLLQAYRLLRGRPHLSRPFSMRRVRRILLMRYDAIGDMLVTTPLIREIARNWPGLEIHVAADPRTFGLLETCPHVRSLIPHPIADLSGAETPRALHKLLRDHLWDLAPDLVIVPKPLDRKLVPPLAFATGARWIAGPVDPYIVRRRRVSYACFLDIRTDPHAVHCVEANLRILEALGGEVESAATQVWLTDGDRESARRLLGSLPGGGIPRLALAPGASTPERRWPPERLESIGRWWQNAHDGQVVLLGSAADREVCVRITTGLGASAVVDLSGKTTLRQAAAVLETCDLLVGMDSGPGHLAAAVDTPVVVVAHMPGAAPSRRFAPWMVPHRLVVPTPRSERCHPMCAFDRPHCIENVTVESVRVAVEELAEGRLGPASTPAGPGRRGEGLVSDPATPG